MFRRPSQCTFEPLESRQMLSGLSYSDGILNITGDRTSSTYVKITKNLRRISVSGIAQRIIDKVTKQIGSARPQMIRIIAGSANDKITFGPRAASIPAFIDGGGGKDRITAGAGNDTIVGGAGNDRIVTGKGHNYVLGGSGNDTIQAQANDTVWGQAGGDTITGTSDASQMAYPLATTALATDFHLGSNTDSSSGFRVATLMLADVTQSAGSDRPTLGPERAVPISLVSQTYRAGVTTQIWAMQDNSVIITARLKNTSSTRNMTVTVANNGAARITQIVFGLPWVYTQATADHAVLSSFRGGTNLPWPTEGFTHQDGGTWPGYSYSPMAVFYNKRTGEGVGLVSFNDRLDTTKVSWVLAADRAGPASHVWPNLDKGQSATYEMELFHGQNMPQQQYDHYRQTFLAPFMARQGIPEANYRKTGVWGSGNFVDPNRETLTDIASRALNLGASGFVQWSEPDGLSQYYEPYQPDFYWAKDLLSSSKLAGMNGLGVLIDPYISRRIANGDGTYRQVDQYLDDPAVQAIVKAQRDDLVRRGVSFAFWDTGNGPRNGSGQDWLNVLWNWKRVGITIAPENSSDIAAWVTGAVMHYPYDWGNPVLAKGVTPNATQFVVQHWDETRQINGKETQWWTDAQSKGLVPILTETQLRERLAELGLG